MFFDIILEIMLSLFYYGVLSGGRNSTVADVGQVDVGRIRSSMTTKVCHNRSVPIKLGRWYSHCLSLGEYNDNRYTKHIVSIDLIPKL